MAEPDNWEEENFEPQVPSGAAAAGDKWEGEDEDDVRDNWDEEEEENKEGQASVVVKKKKTLKERIAEKEAKKAAEVAARKQNEEENKFLSPEEANAEKIRRQKLQEESDLVLAREAFGVKAPPSVQIDSFIAVTKDDFDTFMNLLKEKITQFETSTFYVAFLENLYRDLAAGLEPDDVKGLASILNTLGNEKTKAQKGKVKKKKGPKLVAGKVTDVDSYGDAYEDYDDFI